MPPATDKYKCLFRTHTLRKSVIPPGDYKKSPVFREDIGRNIGFHDRATENSMHIFRKAEKCEKCMDVDLSYQCDHVCDVAPRIGDVSDLHCVAAENGETKISDDKMR